MKKNYIALVLDDSGSMSCVASEAKQAFNAVVSEIKDQAAKQGQETSVTLLLFGVGVQPQFYNSSSASLKPLTHFQPNQPGTALWDGVGKAAEMLSDAGKHETGDSSFLVITITDGGENRSASYTASRLRDLIREKHGTDRWTFTFQVPPNNASQIASSLGVPAGNIREWENTRYGTQEMGAAASVGVTNYFAARSAGATRSQCFYTTTDLSKVTSKQIAKKLDDISDRFKRFEVRDEQAVKEFVENRTRRPYILGSAYYLLMKNERVQPQKQVLIMEKGKKAVWGGPEARDLIGLPRGVEAKVEPGNHANYDIYVQSTSTNRKLPRGTKVLVDVSQVAHRNPTWGTLQGALS